MTQREGLGLCENGLRDVLERGLRDISSATFFEDCTGARKDYLSS